MGKKEVVESLVKGGEASAAPPLGPALGPLGVNINDIINQINEKTALFKGMEVPVKIMIDVETKKFSISIGTPPVTSMLKKEMNVQKLATVSEDGTRNPGGDISLDAVIKIAKSKDLCGNLKTQVKQVLGTCLSSGVTVNGKNAKELIKEINENKVKVE